MTAPPLTGLQPSVFFEGGSGVAGAFRVAEGAWAALIDIDEGDEVTGLPSLPQPSEKLAGELERSVDVRGCVDAQRLVDVEDAQVDAVLQLLGGDRRGAGVIDDGENSGQPCGVFGKLVGEGSYGMKSAAPGASFFDVIGELFPFGNGLRGEAQRRRFKLV